MKNRVNEIDVDIFIHPDGTIRYLFYDVLRPLLDCGKSTVSRASHIDMHLVDDQWKWFADLSPVSGPNLGPFLDRDDAITAEVSWLVENHLNKVD